MKGLLKCTSRLYSDLAKDLGCRAETGKSRLDHIETNKYGEPDKVRMHKVGQQQADQNHTTRKHKHQTINIHNYLRGD